MKTVLTLLAAATFSVPLYAASPNPLCNGVIESEFTQGDGSNASPYLICNENQYRRLINESELWSKYFELGQDIDFNHSRVNPIANFDMPFTGSFDGANHTLSSITLGGDEPTSDLGLFARLKYATITNLNIDNIDNLSTSNWAGLNRGALAGSAEYAKVTNVHVTHASLYAPDHAGGFVGEVKFSNFFNISFAGKLRMHFGSDAVGGLVGLARDSSFQQVVSDAEMDNPDINPTGTSLIGGLIGSLLDSSVSDGIALGRISLVRKIRGPQFFGGLMGGCVRSRVVRTLAAVDMHSLKLSPMGGAIAYDYQCTTDNIYFDKDIAGIDFSATGLGYDTATLKTASFWKDRNFPENYWKIIDGQYPLLK